MNFSRSGTVISSLPSFKNLDNETAFYSLRHDDLVLQSFVYLFTANGDPFDDFQVTITNTIISDPFPRTLWYSTKILLESDNSEIFSGYFSVLQDSPADTTGLVNHFYDLSNQVVDILALNNYYGADRLFSIDTFRFTNNGTNINTFPYVKTLYSNAVFFTLYQDSSPAGLGFIAPLDVTGESLAPIEDVRVKFTNSPVVWYSLEASIQNIDGITNTNVKYYFSVDSSSSLITGFYSYNNIGVNVLFLDPPRNEPPYWSLPNNLFGTTRLLFSYNDGINFTDTYLQTQPIQYLFSPQSTQFTLNYPIFNFYGYDYGDGLRNYLWAYAGPAGAGGNNDLLTNSIDIQLISGPP
jgi:hypothetical protein